MSKSGITISPIANAGSKPSNPKRLDMTAVIANSQTFGLWQYNGSTWDIISVPVFTDDRLMPYVTEIKRSHIQDLRNYAKYLAVISANKYGEIYHNVHDFTGASAVYAPTITLSETIPGSGTYTFSGTSNSDNVATTGFVAQAIASVIGSTPGVLNTLTKIDAALNDDAALATTLVNSISTLNTTLTNSISTLNTTLTNSIATKVASVSATAPVTSTGGTAPTIAIPKATATVDGYISKEDFASFAAKQVAGSFVPTSRRINGYDLSSDIILTANDIAGLLPTLQLSHAYTSPNAWQTISLAGGISAPFFYVIIIGGGGSGGWFNNCWGGGSGGITIKKIIVNPSSIYSVKVGYGGYLTGAYSAANGGDTVVSGSVEGIVATATGGSSGAQARSGSSSTLPFLDGGAPATWPYAGAAGGNGGGYDDTVLNIHATRNGGGAGGFTADGEDEIPIASSGGYGFGAGGAGPRGDNGNGAGIGAGGGASGFILTGTPLSVPSGGATTNLYGYPSQVKAGQGNGAPGACFVFY